MKKNRSWYYVLSLLFLQAAIPHAWGQSQTSTVSSTQNMSSPSGQEQLLPSTQQGKRDEIRALDIVSNQFLVDRQYKSMQGPTDFKQVLLESSEKPELLWIVGYGARPVGEDGSSPRSQEFLCHSNLDLDIQKHNELFGFQKVGRPRLFTISQGQSEVHFPKGFGIPIMSSELINYNTQLLNLNAQEKPFQIKHKGTILYVRDKDLKESLKPLFVITANGVKLLEGKDGYLGVAEANEHTKGSSCSAGIPAANGVTTDFMAHDAYGRKFTMHWTVNPGKEVNHTLITDFLKLSFDTRIHYAAIHLHPFGESFELRDLTAKKTVLKFKTKQAKKGLGLAHVDHFTSEKGVPLYKDHDYEIVTVYDNPTRENQDAMATLFLYALDKEFKKSSL